MERYLAALPLWMVLAYGSACMSERLIPSLWLEFVLLGIMGGALVLGSRRRALANPAQMTLAGMMAGWLVWSCMSNLLAQAPVCSWWKTATYLVMSGLCLAIATTRRSMSDMVEILGSACCLTVLIAGSIIWWYEGYVPGVEGGSFFASFGFGHPNLLLNTVGLGSFSFFWWIAEHQMRGLARPWTLRAIALAGVLATVILAMLLHRRGVAVGIIAGLAVIALRWCWAESRRLAITAMCAAVATMLGVGVWLSFNFIHLARAERMLLYGGMIEIAAEHPFVGSGGYAARRLHEGNSDSARHFTARGEYPVHGHNEILDAATDGGLPAVLLLIMACVWVFLQAWKRPHVCERNWLLLSIGGVLMVSCVDNAYSRAGGLWYVAIIAGLAANGSVDKQSESKSAMGEVRKPIRLTVPLMASGFVALAMAWSLLPAAWIGDQSRSSEFKKAFASLFDPVPLATIFPRSMQSLPLDDMDRSLLVDQHLRRIGASRTTTWYKGSYMFMTGAPISNRFENALDLIRFIPFNRDAWDAAVELVHGDAKLLEGVDKTTQFALRRMSGDPRLSVPAPGLSCQNFNSAVSVACALRWCLLTNTFDSEANRTAERLIDNYGDVPDVGLLICDLLCAGRDIRLTPKRCSIMYPALGYGQLYWNRRVREITDPRIARRFIPLYESVFPQAFKDFAADTITRSRRPYDDDYLIMHLACCHLWGLCPELFQQKAGSPGL